MTDLSPEARALFDAASEAYEPDPERLARIGAAVAVVGSAATVSGSAGAAGSATAGGAAKATTWLSGLKLTSVVIAAVCGSGALVALRTQTDETVWRPLAVESRAQSDLQRPAPSPAAASAGDARAVHAPPSSPAAAPPPALQRNARSAPPGEARKELPVERVTLEEDEEPRSTAQPPASLASPGTAAAGSGSHGATADTLAEEVSWLDTARRALEAGDPARAVAVSAEYGARYPAGALRQEILTVRAVALCRMGRLAEGSRIADALERAASRSPHVQRIRRACARE